MVKRRDVDLRRSYREQGNSLGEAIVEVLSTARLKESANSHLVMAKRYCM
jgi:hypothetical protein